VGDNHEALVVIHIWPQHLLGLEWHACEADRQFGSLSLRVSITSDGTISRDLNRY